MLVNFLCRESSHTVACGDAVTTHSSPKAPPPMEEFILFLDHTIDSKSMEQTVSRNLYKGVLVVF